MRFVIVIVVIVVMILLRTRCSPVVVCCCCCCCCGCRCCSLLTRWQQFGKKPLNPILGETFECKSGDTFYLAEQVSHHPPISAFFFEHIPTGITYYGHAQVIAKFGGNSVAADFAGDAYLYVPKHGELYQFSYPMPTMHARGLLIGKSRNELGGEMWLECEKSGYRANFTFKTTVCLVLPCSLPCRSPLAGTVVDDDARLLLLLLRRLVHRECSAAQKTRWLARSNTRARRRSTPPRGPACGTPRSS